MKENIYSVLWLSLSMCMLATKITCFGSRALRRQPCGDVPCVVH